MIKIAALKTVRRSSGGRCLALVAAIAGAGATLGKADAQEVVGAVGAANAAPTGRAPSKTQRVLKPGDDVFFKDHITTRRGGSAQITFLDRSTLNVGENSDLVIDEFIYKPGEAGTMRAKLNKGVLRFVGGDISHGGGTSVTTPTATIGIRGGIGMIGYLADRAPAVALPGIPSDFAGGTIVVNGYGVLTVRNATSEVTIRRPGFAVFVKADATISAPVRLDMAAAQALVKSLGSRTGQTGGASAKARAATVSVAASLVPSMDLPIAHPVPAAPVNGLDYTSVFNIGNALARNRAQVQQANQVQQQIALTALAASAAAPVQSTTMTTTAASGSSSATTPVTAPVTTPISSAPVTTPVSPPLTNPPVTPVITAPVTTPPLTTPIIVTPVAAPPVTTLPVTTAPVTTAPVMTAPVTTAPVTTAPVTTAPVTTPPVMTAPVMTVPVMTVPVTTPPVTTPPVMTAPVTTPPVMTAPVTTVPVTTPPVMTPPVMIAPVTPPTPSTTLYDINAGIVTANVIYAHTILSGHIEGTVVYGTNYGSNSGTTYSGASLITTGTLYANVINAGTVKATTIYVDATNH